MKPCSALLDVRQGHVRLDGEDITALSTGKAVWLRECFVAANLEYLLPR